MRPARYPRVPFSDAPDGRIVLGADGAVWGLVNVSQTPAAPLFISGRSDAIGWGLSIDQAPALGVVLRRAWVVVASNDVMATMRWGLVAYDQMTGATTNNLTSP